MNRGWRIGLPALKIKFVACVGQATYHDIHKIAFFLWRKWIRTVECGILVIKKASVRTLQIGFYSVFLKVSIKHIQEKEIWYKKNTYLSQLLFNCNIEKTKIMVFYVNFVSWAYIYFGSCHVVLISLICEYVSWSWTDKSETLRKLSNHQNLCWKRSLISTLQISAMLDYGKDCCRRICEEIKINKNCWQYLGSGGHGNHSTRIFGGH